ncbi:hypothetical protein Goari_027251 [Gossypium aridum]|uniref:Uncharacterized protein n=1 Tax=Gossypium aridum TaxID=34290 RepID=A0A7J8YLN3_GOSAI|nr:hypothetical protein [Gossypium aridum]
MKQRSRFAETPEFILHAHVAASLKNLECGEPARVGSGYGPENLLEQRLVAWDGRAYDKSPETGAHADRHVSSRNIRRRMSVIVVVGRYPGIPSPLLQHLSDPNYLTNFLAFSHSVIHSFPKKVTENEQGTLKGKENTFRESERKRKSEVEEGSFRWDNYEIVSAVSMGVMAM